MLSSRKLIAVFLFTGWVSACGFQPVYTSAPSGTTEAGSDAISLFQNVDIGYLPDREGQYFRNRLTQLLHFRGQQAAPRYNLSMDLNESTSSLAVQRTAQATRASLKMTVRYQLVEKTAGRSSVLTGSLSATSGYNIFQSEFQTLAAEQGARERALDSLADQLRLRLASFAASPQNPAGSS